MISVESILASGNKTVPVDVPEWGGEVRVKPLSVADLMATLEQGSDAARTVRLVARSLCDETGARLFATEQGEDLLLHASGAGLLRVAAVCLDLNGLTEKSQVQLGKASAPTPVGATSSDSPANSDGPSAS